MIRTLAESKNYILCHEYESVYVQHKSSTKEKLYIGSHYGDPKCGIIAPTETWFLAGGEGLTFFDFLQGATEIIRESRKVIRDSENRVKRIVDSSPKWWVHSMRLETKYSVRILIDPWDDFASTWLLNIPDLKLTKLRDGPSFIDQPYREEIDF